MIALQKINHPLFTESRKVWMQRTSSRPATDCLIVLDAEIYIDSIHTPDMVHKLQQAGHLTAVDCVYLSSLDSAARHHDFACNEAFADFLATDMIQWITQNLQSYERYFLCGRSLSGLCAVFTGLRYPALFAGIISQSPSAWWNDEWLVNSLTQTNMLRNRLWISVGNKEVASGVSHAPTGMFQKTSQIDSVHRLVDKLQLVCKDLHYTQYLGGHDTACWAAELPEALIWTTQNPSVTAKKNTTMGERCGAVAL